MITKITVENFKSHEHTVIEPGRVTALVGPNGCGKTSVLKAIEFLTNSEKRTWIYPLRRQGEEDFSIVISGQENSNNGVDLPSAWQFSYSRKTSSDDAAGKIVYGLKWGKVAAEDKQHISDNDPVFRNVKSALGEAVYCKISIEKISAPFYSEEIPPVVTPDGQGLASVIADLKSNDSERFLQIMKGLKGIVPSIRNVRVRLVRFSVTESRSLKVESQVVRYNEDVSRIGQVLVFDTDSAKEIPASEMSEGTLLVFGLLAILHTSNSPGLFLLDDIEAGLHPLAQRKLMQVLKEFAEKYDRQIILTTHSPYIVDELDAKDVWVMALDKEGIARTKRLSDHPDAKRALEVLTTGELWDAEGESWVTKESVPEEQVNA